MSITREELEQLVRNAKANADSWTNDDSAACRALHKEWTLIHTALSEYLQLMQEKEEQQ